MAFSLLPFRESELAAGIGERFGRVAAHSPDRPWYIRWGSQAGWRPCIKGELISIGILGNHATVMQEPFVQVLAMKLRACLDEYNH